MRTGRAALRGLWLVLVAAGCGEPPAPPPAVVSAPAPSAALAPVAPAPKAPAAAQPAAAAVDAPKVVSDQWYRTLQDGQPSGWRHVRWTRTVRDGVVSIHDRTEGYSSTTRQMGGEADTFEAREYSDLDRTEDGLVVRFESRGVQADRVSESVQSWNGKGYDLVSRVAGLEEKHAVACAERCPTDTEMYLSKMLQDGRVAVGAHLEYQTPNFLAGRLDTVSLAVEAKEKLSLPGGEFDCFRVIETVSGAPADAKTTWWLDSAGVLRRLRSGRLEIVASTQAKARELRDGGAVYSITVEADPQMVRCTSLDRALVELTLAPRDDAEMPNIPATPFGREVSRDGNRIRVELTAHDEAALAVSLPVTDPKFAKHLERTNLFCWDAPRVKAALASAVGDEKDPQKIVTRILRYVFVNLRKSSGPIPEPTAVEILEDGGGDCSEHCVLFVTLCRAAGIPARRLSGYAQVGDMWGAHSFAEVWLGRWIGCDPTTNEFGTKARYVAFGWEDDPDSFPGLVSSRISGRVKIRTLEFTEGGRTWKTDGLENPSDRVDLLSGLAFADPPAGWYASVSGTGDGHFTGPGVRGDISTVAGYGDLPCDVLSQRMMRGWKTVKWAGRDTLRDDIAVHGHVTVRITVPFRRRMMSITMRVDDAKKVDAALETLAKLLAPTLD